MSDNKNELKPNKELNKKKIIKTAIIGIVSMLIIAVIGISTIYMLWKRGFFIPKYVTWNSQSDTFLIEKKVNDNGYDKIGDETDNGDKKSDNEIDDAYDVIEKVDFSLKKKRLKITVHETGELLYESPKEWLVSDYFLADIDSDDEDEVVLMVWKQGSFGKHKPFWHEGKKDNKWTQHIFIYEWDCERTDRLDPKWMSSGLGIKVHKVNIDEKNRVHFTDDKGEETIWQWLGWGLTLVQVIK